ncbi:MAG: SulP family inorganic anion transporter [Deltaproteobacteria bacterium]|nr:MAG: SulP family inorganic anion transporter [Deltaproteobacteria bacterium]
MSPEKSSWRRLATPLMPIVRTFRTYRTRDLPHDLLAGLTVSVVDLPQSMAFAVIAGVPPVYGLYTAIFLAFLGALFTSSRFLSVGPTNTQSLLIAATVSRLTHDPEVYVQLVIALAFVKGAIQLVFAAVRMGQFVRYVSATVMVGFTAGAGVLIFAEQVPNFLGFARSHGGAEHLPGVLDVFRDVAAHVADINPHAVLLGAGSLTVMLVLRRVSEVLPGPLIAVGLSALVVANAGWTDVAIVGALPEGLPAVQLPHLDLPIVEKLLPGALALALLGMLESVAIAKSIAHKTGQRIDADQEFFGQGFANLVGALFQSMPGSGSFSRTALQYTVGARTRVASLFTAFANAVFFLALAPLAYHIPLASLAAILFYVAYKLIDGRAIWRIVRSSRADAVVALVTLASALLLPLTYAIYVGIFLNIALYLKRASQLHLLHMEPISAAGFREHPVAPGDEPEDDILILHLEGDLFFGIADELEDRLRAIEAGPTQVVIFRLKRTHSIDASILFVLDRFVGRMHEGDRHVLMCGVPAGARRAMRGFGLEERIGRDNLWDAVPDTFTTTRAALKHARALIGKRSAPDAFLGAGI